MIWYLLIALALGIYIGVTTGMDEMEATMKPKVTKAMTKWVESKRDRRLLMALLNDSQDREEAGLELLKESHEREDYMQTRLEQAVEQLEEMVPTEPTGRFDFRSIEP